MILGIFIFFTILFMGSLFLMEVNWEHEEIWFIMFILSGLIGFGVLMFGLFNGFINYPATEGTHQGVITAVDLEGVWYRKYKVYLKSSGYTNQSDETRYLIYDYETELAEQLKNVIGKTVKLHYGHDGGYIGIGSCGTYHIKSVEIIEE